MEKTNKIIVVRRRLGDKDFEPIGELIRRMALVVRTVFDKHNSAVLEGRGFTNISSVIELVSSNNLKNVIKISETSLIVEDFQQNDRTRRVPYIKVTLVKP